MQSIAAQSRGWTDLGIKGKLHLNWLLDSDLFLLVQKGLFFIASWLQGYEVAKGKPVISLDLATNTGLWFAFCVTVNSSNNWQNDPTKDTAVKS